MPERRRASDHPYEVFVRLGLGVLFASAAVFFGYVENNVAMGTCLVACGAMMKIPISKVLPK